MRKTLLTIFAAMLTTVSTSAADISLQSAKTLAAQYVTVPQVQRAKSNTSGGTATDKLLNHFYCFNDASGKGFVLISDDDCVQPVLGYSDSGAFDVDHVPVQLQDWLTAVSQYISKNKAAGKTVAALKVMTPNGSHWIRIIPVSSSRRTSLLVSVCSLSPKVQAVTTMPRTIRCRVFVSQPVPHHRDCISAKVRRWW